MADPATLSSCSGYYNLNPTLESQAADLYRLTRQDNNLFDALNQGNINTVSAIFSPRHENANVWYIACFLLFGVTGAVLYNLGMKEFHIIDQTPRGEMSLSRIRANGPKYFSTAMLSWYVLIVLAMLVVNGVVVVNFFESVITKNALSCSVMATAGSSIWENLIGVSDFHINLADQVASSNRTSLLEEYRETSQDLLATLQNTAKKPCEWCDSVEDQLNLFHLALQNTVNQQDDRIKSLYNHEAELYGSTHNQTEKLHTLLQKLTAKHAAEYQHHLEDDPAYTSSSTFMLYICADLTVFLSLFFLYQVSNILRVALASGDIGKFRKAVLSASIVGGLLTALCVYVSGVFTNAGLLAAEVGLRVQPSATTALAADADVFHLMGTPAPLSNLISACHNSTAGAKLLTFEQKSNDFAESRAGISSNRHLLTSAMMTSMTSLFPDTNIESSQDMLEEMLQQSAVGSERISSNDLIHANSDEGSLENRLNNLVEHVPTSQNIQMREVEAAEVKPNIVGHVANVPAEPHRIGRLRGAVSNQQQAQDQSQQIEPQQPQPQQHQHQKLQAMPHQAAHEAQQKVPQNFADRNANLIEKKVLAQQSDFLPPPTFNLFQKRNDIAEDVYPTQHVEAPAAAPASSATTNERVPQASLLQSEEILQQPTGAHVSTTAKTDAYNSARQLHEQALKSTRGVEEKITERKVSN